MQFDLKLEDRDSDLKKFLATSHTFILALAKGKVKRVILKDEDEKSPISESSDSGVSQ